MLTLTNEDCMELMSRYPDGYFELAIVDPPYGIGESSKNRNGITKIKDKRKGRINYVKTNNEIKDWDKTPPTCGVFYRVAKSFKKSNYLGR